MQCIHGRARPEREKFGVLIRQEICAAHSWLASSTPKPRASAVSPAAPVTANTALSSGQAASKTEKLEACGSIARVDDVTADVFSFRGQVVADSIANGLEEQCSSARVVLPRVAIVKFLEAIDVCQKMGGEAVPGYLWSVPMEKGKFCGREFVRALFVGAGSLDPQTGPLVAVAARTRGRHTATCIRCIISQTVPHTRQAHGQYDPRLSPMSCDWLYACHSAGVRVPGTC